MLNHHQVQGVLCAALALTGLLLTSCTHDPVEPAPVSIRGVNRTMNSAAPVVATPLAAPRSITASPRRAMESSRAHASGGAVTKGKRSADAQKPHRHRAPPQMVRAVKAHRTARSAAPATTLA